MSVSVIRRWVGDDVKNTMGWSAPSRLVAFAVDDFGNVRLSSPQAKNRLRAAGVRISKPMDRLDALETRKDLESLFEALRAVQDGAGRPAVFTAYAMSANPNFPAIRSEGSYSYEPLPETFRRLSTTQPDAYKGAWDLWRDGIRRRLIWPQFHGREHVNVALIQRALDRGDPIVQANIANDSMVAIPRDPAMPGVGFTHSFGIHALSALPAQKEILIDGVKRFEDVFGFRSRTFTPPAQRLHPALHETAERHGIEGIHKPWIGRPALPRHRWAREVRFSGKRVGEHHVTIVRNVVFEPCHGSARDPVAHALRQIAAAFRWRKPAIISSHRVNFIGHISPENRERGLAALRALLRGIVDRWPDVEFVTVDELLDRVKAS